MKFASLKLAATLLFALSLASGECAAAGDPAPVGERKPHVYVGKKGDAFVYEKVPLSDTQAPEYALVWYMGKENNEPVFRYQDAQMTAILKCDPGCQYVEWTEVKGRKGAGIGPAKGRIRMTNDPLIYSIVRDATAGLLD